VPETSETGHVDEVRPAGVSTVIAIAGWFPGAIVGNSNHGPQKRLWQSGFRVRLAATFLRPYIRDDTSLDRIRQYIKDNPAKWDPDEAIPENLWM
jgi:hypothetical protein